MPGDGVRVGPSDREHRPGEILLRDAGTLERRVGHLEQRVHGGMHAHCILVAGSTVREVKRVRVQVQHRRLGLGGAAVDAHDEAGLRVRHRLCERGGDRDERVRAHAWGSSQDLRPG